MIYIFNLVNIRIFRWKWIFDKNRFIEVFLYYKLNVITAVTHVNILSRLINFINFFSDLSDLHKYFFLREKRVEIMVIISANSVVDNIIYRNRSLCAFTCSLCFSRHTVEIREMEIRGNSIFYYFHQNFIYQT